MITLKFPSFYHRDIFSSILLIGSTLGARAFVSQNGVEYCNCDISRHQNGRAGFLLNNCESNQFGEKMKMGGWDKERKKKMGDDDINLYHFTPCLFNFPWLRTFSEMSWQHPWSLDEVNRVRSSLIFRTHHISGQHYTAPCIFSGRTINKTSLRGRGSKQDTKDDWRGSQWPRRDFADDFRYNHATAPVFISLQF